MQICIENQIEKRSTGRLSASQLKPVREAFESSKVLHDFDSKRRRNKGSLKFTTIQMLILLMYIEIKKLTFAEMHHIFDGRGGQVILKNLGMPEIDGKFVYPSDGWISDFRNNQYPLFRENFEKEIQTMVLEMKKGKDVRFTVDSTPVEASRYSKFANYNVHYNIRMFKEHMIMIDGIPLYSQFTNGNVNDCPVFEMLLKNFDGVKIPNAKMLADGGYDSFDSYAQTFLRTGCVMYGNPGINGVYHEEAEWKDIIRRYNKLNKTAGFVPQTQTSPEHILRFMLKNGENELVGKYLRNLDIRRGNRIYAEAALERHICETVHHAMKRWIDFDARGIMYDFLESRFSLKVIFCTFLALMFKPYTN